MHFSQWQLLRSAVIGCGLWSCVLETNAFEQIRFPSQSVVSAMYRAEFGERVELPARYESTAGAECGGYPYLTSTAYLNVSDERADVLTLHLAPDGSLLRKVRRRVPKPAGRIKVLAVLVRYAETFDDRAIEAWQGAQRQVNQDHEAFARKRGYARPLVTFENTNLVLERVDVPDPYLHGYIRAAIKAKGIDLDKFQMLVTIDMDPRRIRGGQARRSTYSVYVGNAAGWKSALSEKQWYGVATTAYHHEIFHLWGWEHDWSPSCKPFPFQPFATAPALLGWDDVDGDRIPEIEDPHPYGNSPIGR